MTSGLFSSGGAKGAKGAELDTQGHRATGYTGWTFKTDAGAAIEKGIGLTPRTSEHVADGAIDFIKRKHDKPFLLHVNFAAPHDPRMMPPGLRGRCNRKKVPLPKNFRAAASVDHGNIGGRDEVLLKKPLDEDDVRRELACYYAVSSSHGRADGPHLCPRSMPLERATTRSSSSPPTRDSRWAATA